LTSPLLSTNSQTAELPKEETVLKVAIGVPIPTENSVKEAKTDPVATTTTTTGNMNREEGEERTGEIGEIGETGETGEEIINKPAIPTIGRIIRDMTAEEKMVPEKGETREPTTETTTEAITKITKKEIDPKETMKETTKEITKEITKETMKNTTKETIRERKTINLDMNIPRKEKNSEEIESL